MNDPKFVIFYGDGSKYSGDPYNAPTLDVQVIVQEAANEQGFILIHGKNLKGYYCWRPGQGWFLCDDAGYWQYKFKRGFAKYMIYGDTMADTSAFFRLLTRAAQEGLVP